MSRNYNDLQKKPLHLGIYIVNYFDVVLVIAFWVPLFYLYWLFDMYKIINNLKECNTKLAVSKVSTGTTHLTVADFEGQVSSEDATCCISMLRQVGSMVSYSLHPLIICKRISYSMLRALSRKAGHRGNVVVTAWLWHESRTQAGCSWGARTFPIP